ncbi:MAG: T9SS type A sorting domain-containing protein [Bacteroidales bacterium]|nr:T9SS type A sorting domain-containing protein [Bacteroidales bacterium]
MPTFYQCGAEVDLSGYGKGVYLVVFDIDGKLVEKKVVVE